MISESVVRPSANSIFDGTYEMLATVGRGRNSVVYKARKFTSSNIVALKVLVGSSKNPLANEKRMRREALAMLASRHRNVIKLVDFVVGEELCYLAMEYAEQGDLNALLERNANLLPIEYVLSLMVQVLHGLAAIHRAGIVHRDIKPENLLLTSDGTIKIADFGIAYLPTEQISLEEANLGIGTFDYLAPESLDEGRRDERTDIYSVAVTCYQLLTRKLPFEGTTFTEQIENKMAGRYQALSSVLPDVPSGLETLLAKALSNNPSGRFQSARDFRLAIEALLKHKEPGSADSSVENLLLISDQQTTTDLNIPEEHVAIEKQESDLLSQPTIQNLFDSDTEIQNADIEEVNDDVYYNSAEGRILRWIFSPRVVIIFLLALILLIWSIKTPKGTEQNTADLSRGVNKEDKFSDSGKVGEDKRQINYDFTGEHTGLLSSFFHDGLDMPFTLSSIGSSGTDTGNKVVVMLGAEGWEPVVTDLTPLLRNEVVTVSSSGLSFSLRIENRVENGKPLSGHYKESTTGKEGTWIIW